MERTAAQMQSPPPATGHEARASAGGGLRCQPSFRQRTIAKPPCTCAWLLAAATRQDGFRRAAKGIRGIVNQQPGVGGQGKAQQGGELIIPVISWATPPNCDLTPVHRLSACWEDRQLSATRGGLDHRYHQQAGSRGVRRPPERQPPIGPNSRVADDCRCSILTWIQGSARVQCILNAAASFEV